MDDEPGAKRRRIETKPKKKKTKSLRLKLLAELRAKVKSTKLRVRDTKKELTQLQRDIKSLSCRKGLGTS